MMARVIVGAFGCPERTELIARRNIGATALDIKSRSVVRLINGRLASSHLSPNSLAIFILLAVPPCFADHKQLEEQLWGQREDGGPAGGRTNAWVHVSRLRRRLAPLRLHIETMWGVGLRLCDAEGRV
jgi:DNA-binding response OmpR family regulator